MTSDSINVSKDNLTEENAHLFIAEASSIGLKPGQWPEYIFVMPKIGNGMVFQRRSPITSQDGDLRAVKYLQQLGCAELVVLND